MKLYILIAHNYEIYTSFLLCCSLKKLSVKKKAMEWKDTESAYGPLEFKIDSIDVDENFINDIESVIKKYKILINVKFKIIEKEKKFFSETPYIVKVVGLPDNKELQYQEVIEDCVYVI